VEPESPQRHRGQEEHIRRQLMLKQMLLRQGLTSEARERLGRVRAANPDLVEQAENLCIQLIQQGRQVDDATMKVILDRLTPKRDIRITRR